MSVPDDLRSTHSEKTKNYMRAPRSVKRITFNPSEANPGETLRVYVPKLNENEGGEGDPRLYVIICEQHQVEIFLKLASFAFEGTNTLILLDDCAASKDVKGRTGELVKLGFSAHHAGISVWMLTQQLSSIAKPFRENVAAIVLFYTPLVHGPRPPK